ncbi:MAG: hypothetical protein KAU10_06165 [Dehalococcoidia bacterium]|nr:hypothetical protein [Dehalococcoidia bacterium]
MRRRRNRFSRLGLLSLALLLSLCVTGIGYAVWWDTTSIEGTMRMGHIEVVLSQGICSDPAITCSVPTPHTLVVTLTNGPGGTYVCGFTVTNTGTIPVKIQSIDIDPAGIPDGVDVSVSGVAEDTQIEQAGVHPDSVAGAVFVTVPAGCEGMFSFSITFSFIQWNLYVG